MFETGTAMV